MAADAHLTMIQTVISRLASQSTTVKGWCVTVTAALLGLGAAATRPIIAIVAVYVIVAFASLDSYYLSLERAYRDLYRATAATTASEPVTGWSMDVAKPTTRDIAHAMLSPAILILYSTSFIATLTIAIYLLTT
jgi:hypothetical protein